MDFNHFIVLVNLDLFSLVLALVVKLPYVPFINLFVVLLMLHYEVP